MKNNLTLIDTATADMRELSDALDRIQQARMQPTIKQMILRHGKGRTLQAVIDAMREADSEAGAGGAKW